MEHKHTISVIVENEPGVLARVAGLFARRGFNIESLAVGTTEDPRLSRMTIVVTGDDRVLEQITKQLYKQIDVLRVFDLPSDSAVECELLLIKVAVGSANREEITQIANLEEAKIVDVAADTLTLEISGASAKVEGFIKLMEKFGIKELVRTGRIALSRGETDKKRS